MIHLSNKNFFILEAFMNVLEFKDFANTVKIWMHSKGKDLHIKILFY